MNAMSQTSSRPGLDQAEPLTIAVLAMGGQGGGVLVDWIVALAEANGWIAQSTSVPGVAQRTGATIYYLEMVPMPLVAGRRPVLALMPTPGEVDVVLGAELMEGGRAMLRGLVTPDRTTLITSAHRSYAIEERARPGDGTAEPGFVHEAAAVAARRYIALDMAAIAEQSGSVISAVLFGALAASGVPPFGRDSFEATIRAGGVGVEPSLRAFDGGVRATLDADSPPTLADAVPNAPAASTLAPVGNVGFDHLLAQARRDVPLQAHAMVAAGLRRVADYQDLRYAEEYLELVQGFVVRDQAAGGDAHGHELVVEAARHIANAMAYDDVIRVADLKTRSSRFQRIAHEMGQKPGQPMGITEFMHPRAEEVWAMMPSALGRATERSRRARALLQRLFSRGRRVRTDTVGWYVLLSIVAGLRRWRRGTLRHQRETAHRDAWLGRVRLASEQDYELAVELLRARRLVKGYGDTHARGHSKFDQVMTASDRLTGRSFAATWVRLLREAALRDDETGHALADTLRTLETLL